MKKTKLFAALVLAASLCGCQQGKYRCETVDGDLMNTHIYKLDNGLTVYISPNTETPKIQCDIAVRTGSRNDPAETTGLAHYLEHLLFKGTTQFGTTDYAAEKPLLDEIEALYEHYRTLTDPEERRACYHEIDSVSQLAAQYFIPNEYDKLMSLIGATGTNAYTGNDVTCYTETVPANEFENWLKIQSDRFTDMVIRGFHTELEAVYEEYNMSLPHDFVKSADAMMALLFPNHPYGTQTTIGTQEHLKNPSITNIKRYFEKYYVPNNIAICIAGDVNPDSAIVLIDRYFGQWKSNSDAEWPEYEPLPPVVQRDTTVYGQEAEMVTLSWRFDGGASRQVDTLNVITKMLANGKAGLLEIDLEQKMLARSIYAATEALADYSMFGVVGFPADNQSTEELRGLILGEIEKLKAGDFSDDLLPAVVNNMKVDYYNELRSNDSRADYLVNAFILGRPWEEQVGAMERIAGITKEQIVDFANRHLNDNFVCVYKKQGVDTTLKKIDKPAITPIPANRDERSPYLQAIAETETKPIEPRFLDFTKDLSVTETAQGTPLLYKQNTDDGLFELRLRYDFGTEDVRGMDLAPDYLYYIGTDSMTTEEVKQAFYKLACNYSVSVGARTTTVNLSGLGENAEPALALLLNLLSNAKGDRESYDNYINLLMKSRQDDKTNQSANFNALGNYGNYGAYNPYRNTLSEKELRGTSPELLTDMLHALCGYEHTVMYYGPTGEDELSSMLSRLYGSDAKFAPVPQGKPYTREETPANEVWLAPYDAKNIYMMQIHNEGREWHPEEAAVKALFNEYFNGGMNGIVFQELREARGLAYYASAMYTEPSNTQSPESFYTAIISQSDKMTDCIGVFNSILDSLPQSQSAFDIAKQSLTKKLESARTTRFGILNAYVEAKERGIDYDINKKIYEQLPSLTLQDIVDFEQKNMANKTFRYIILGNEPDLDTKALQRIAPIRRLSTKEIFGY